MTGCSGPQLPFNPITDPVALGGLEILAGPLGLLAFLPLLPFVRSFARVRPRTALIGGGLLWVFGTLGLPTLIIVLAALLLASLWVTGLGALRRRGTIGPRTMIALVWLGLHVLVLPFWWQPGHWWYGWQPLRIPVLHSVGLAYFLLRFIAWGVELARNPNDRLRAAGTLAWLAYPMCMRNGPVMLRHQFLERLAAWNPRAAPPVRETVQRFGLAFLGVVGLAVSSALIPRVAERAADFFAAPQDYSTGELLRVVYFVPIVVYLFLWTYNGFAVAMSLWLGIRVDDNFHWLPKATSVRDFWRRWHITVGAWLRDYIYIPLRGNRGIVPLNYVAVFAYCAVWHGPSWSFLAWGLSQAFALAVQRWWDRLREKVGWRDKPTGLLWTVFCWLLTMHYQIATIVVFADFEHLGSRIFPELLRRLLGSAP